MIRIGSKQGKRKLSYNESVDEPAKLIADEAVEVEAEISEENKPVERIENDDRFEAPMFDES
jgi:hypothetical protein